MTKSGFHAYIELERLASRIDSYETTFVHGLLQLESYMRWLFNRTSSFSPARIEELVQQRRRRQKDFEVRGASVVLNVMLGEAVLRSNCPEEQLDHLMEADRKPNITVNYLPFESGPHPGLEVPFHVLSFTEEDDPDLAYFDAPDGARYIELPESVADFRKVVDNGRERARSIKEFKL